MIREFITQLLENHLSWAVTPIDEFFDFLFRPAATTFEEYAASVTTSPGLVEELIALGLGLGFSFVSILGIYLLLDLLSFAFNPVIRRVSGQSATRRTRLVVSGGVYAVLQAVDFATTGNLYLVEMMNRISKDLTAVISMYQGHTPTTVTLDAFTWGLLGNPLLEFSVQIGILIIVVTGVVWRFTMHSESTVALALTALTVGSWVYAEVMGVQVFPLDARVALPLQLLVLWGLMTVIGGVISLGFWVLLEWLPWVRYDQSQPRKLYMTFDGLLLLVMFPLFANSVTAIWGWLSYKVWRHGGTEKAVRIVADHPPCRPDPETGQQVCSWEHAGRGD